MQFIPILSVLVLGLSLISLVFLSLLIYLSILSFPLPSSFLIVRPNLLKRDLRLWVETGPIFVYG